tara:strand:+ start:4268 stop:4396 length:129 start_codon:yes stop_codon:yes gene_type:complete
VKVYPLVGQAKDEANGTQLEIGDALQLFADFECVAARDGIAN